MTLSGCSRKCDETPACFDTRGKDAPLCRGAGWDPQLFDLERRQAVEASSLGKGWVQVVPGFSLVGNAAAV